MNQRDMLTLKTMLSDADFPKLVRADLGDTYSFHVLEPDFQIIRLIWSILLKENRPKMPAFVENQVDKMAEVSYKNLFHLANISRSGVTSAHETIINDVQRHVAALHDAFIPYILFNIGSGELANTISDQVKVADSHLKSAKKILEDATSHAAVKAASSHASDYEKQADKHFWAGLVWLLVIILLAVSTAGLAVFTYLIQTTGGPINFSQLTSKILLFAVFLFLLTNAARLYRVNVNQKLVNQGKAHALRTFEIFVHNSKDDATKAAVLLQTTATIFGPINTGLSGHEPEPQIMPVSLDALIKTVAPK